MRKNLKPVGVYSLRMRVACEPLVLWRWGGWFPALIGCGFGLASMFAAAVLDDLGTIQVRSPFALLCWFLIGAPFFFTYQRTEFDNEEMVVRVLFGVVIPLWRVAIPYAGVKGIGTDYHLVHVFPRPKESAIDLFLYTRSRRAFLLSRHWSEAGYREAVEHIRRHVGFPILRLE